MQRAWWLETAGSKNAVRTTRGIQARFGPGSPVFAAIRSTADSHEVVRVWCRAHVGPNYIQAGRWYGFAVRDGNLITGQQNFSGAETAELVVRALGE